MLARLNRKPYRIAIAAIAGAAALGLVYYLAIYSPRQAEATEPEIQTSVVRRGDLTLYASGSGTLIAGKQAELGFGTSGTVQATYVQPGDIVEAGQILAEQADIEALEAEVAAADLALHEAREALETLHEQADLVAAEAQVAVAEAQEALEDAQRTWQYQQEGYRASSVTIKAAEAALVVAQDAMERAESRSDDFEDDDPQGAQAYKNYAAAVQAYRSALANLNWYTGHPTETQQAGLDAAVALATAQLAEAQRAYEKVNDGPDPDEVTKAELQVAAAEAELASAQRNLDMAVIEAPFAGTVMEISANPGDEVTGAFLTLADLSVAQLEISLDETDADKIAVGHPVEVVFDTYPDDLYTGTVVQVDPRLSTEFGLATVEGLVQLDGDSFDGLLLGMNASVDVISGRAEGVALVPVEALRELEPDEYAVFVMEDGQPRLRTVEVGLMDLTFAEIKSGLEVGEIVTTGVVETG
jgi:RND family efflux transporter MFP subunit